MGIRAAVVHYILALVAVVVDVVDVDVLFFMHHFLERLLANVGIVLVFTPFSVPAQSRNAGYAKLSASSPIQPMPGPLSRR